MEIKVLHNAGAVAEAIAKSPETVLPRVDAALLTGAGLLARAIRAEAPHGTDEHLVHSVGIADRFLVKTIKVAAAYAVPVHQGAKPGGRPTLAAMLAWVRRKHITPHDPRMSEKSLAFLMRRRIAQQGQPPNPFVTRAFDAQAPRLTELVQAAALQGLAEGRV